MSEELTLFPQVQFIEFSMYYVRYLFTYQNSPVVHRYTVGSRYLPRELNNNYVLRVNQLSNPEKSKISNGVSAGGKINDPLFHPAFNEKTLSDRVPLYKKSLFPSIFVQTVLQ